MSYPHLTFPNCKVPCDNDSIFYISFWENLATRFIHDLALYSAAGTVLVIIYWAICTINRGNQAFQSRLKCKEKEVEDKRWGWGGNNMGWGDGNMGWGGDGNTGDPDAGGANDNDNQQEEDELAMEVQPQLAQDEPPIFQDEQAPEVDLEFLHEDVA